MHCQEEYSHILLFSLQFVGTHYVCVGGNNLLCVERVSHFQPGLKLFSWDVSCMNDPTNCEPCKRVIVINCVSIALAQTFYKSFVYLRECIFNFLGC